MPNQQMKVFRRPLWDSFTEEDHHPIDAFSTKMSYEAMMKNALVRHCRQSNLFLKDHFAYIGENGM